MGELQTVIDSRGAPVATIEISAVEVLRLEWGEEAPVLDDDTSVVVQWFRVRRDQRGSGSASLG